MIGNIKITDKTFTLYYEDGEVLASKFDAIPAVISENKNAAAISDQNYIWVLNVDQFEIVEIFSDEEDQNEPAKN